jgi:two-component system, chemotaxis family, CheB/CheR fusion protein
MMSSNKDFCVVGIGASAGGLEAIEAFFTNVPVDSGLAFVIVQHLSPDYKSLMPEILIKRTSLPVHTAEDGMIVSPNNVYLIPRKMNMKIFHAKLHLTEKTNLNILNLPIDIFLHSLAEDFEDKAIGVILSGTGSDGSRGIRVIKENGGIIIAQDPETAKFDGMPKSAISTGTVDFILPPQDIAVKILNYIKHPYARVQDNNLSTKVPEDFLAKIILLLKENFGLDFTYYKDTTISRRIERRLSINQIATLRDYLDYLYASKNEQKTLYNELLIGVTKFFRDTEAFQFIEQNIIPEIFAQKSPKHEIRVWVSACSTGEEAYSVAILFKEFMLKNSLHNEIKIFATDVDKSAIEYASAGTYNASLTADVSPDRLHKFFTQVGDSYRINADIREMIVFAAHNVIKDPPFNKIDFLTCRNLLIYFQTNLQQKVLSLFNFALNAHGYLFLGNSETIGEMEHYYDTVHSKWKVYTPKDNIRPPHGELLAVTPLISNIIKVNKQLHKPTYVLKTSIPDLTSIFTDKILEDNAPETVIVNENYEIINSFGNPNKYLTLPKNSKIVDGFEFIITRMIPQNLKLTFSISINKSIKSGREIIHPNVKFQKNNGETSIIDLKFVPLIEPRLNDKFVIIYFIEKDVQYANQEITSFAEVDQQALQRICDLENELKHTKENLQASIEELETTNEELQSTNEELVSANEELQSTNEELQSVNEELYTVNTEFQAKNHDLVIMNNDMENLLQNSEIRIIFLDLELKVRKFTENVTDIFNLRSNDYGRPLSDITHHILDTNLLRKANIIIKNHSTIQKVVQAKGKWYQMKMLPYLTQKGYMDGIVVSFIDISDYYRSQQELKLSENKFKHVVNLSFDAFYLLEIKRDFTGLISNFIVSDVNRRTEEQLGMSREQLIGSDICKLFPHNCNQGLFDKYKRAAESGLPIEEEYYISDNPVAQGWYYQQVVPLGDEIVVFNRDITERKMIEYRLREVNHFYRALVQNITDGFALHEIIVNEDNIAVDYRFLEVNNRFAEITGINTDLIIGKTIKQILPQIEAYWIDTYAKVALNQEILLFVYTSKALNKKFKVRAYSPKKGQFVTLFREVQD